MDAGDPPLESTSHESRLLKTMSVTVTKPLKMCCRFVVHEQVQMQKGEKQCSGRYFYEALQAGGSMELVFPPLWTPIESAYLSIPSLKAFLEEKGYRTHQTDVSILVWNSIFSKKYMEYVKDQINREIDKFSSSPSLDRLKITKYNTLSLARLLLDTVTPDLIDEARRTMREKKVISPLEIKRVVGILSDATYIISSLHYPTRIRLDAFLTRYYYDHSLPHLMSTVTDEEENPFIDIYQFLEVPQRILNKADGVIGFSVGCIDQLIPSLTLANLIKKIDPHVFIVFGGPFLLYMGRSLEMPSLFHMIDGFILGEGETPLYQLVDALENNRLLDRVPNLTYKDSSDRIRKPELHTIEDINALPTPSFEDLDLDAYFNSARVAPLLTSRGCYWNRCAFCSDHFTFGSKYRERDMDLLIEDIKKLYHDYDTKSIIFTDQGIRAHRMDLLSDAILREGLDISWITFIRLEKGFTKPLFEKAFKAGCRLISVGLESGSQRVLDLIDKGTTVDEALEIIRNAHDSGLWVNVFTIIGFPGETTEDARMTTEFMVKNHNIFDSNSMGICVVMYGSKLYLNREKYGITLQNNFDYGLMYRREAGEYEVSGGMSKEEILKAKDSYDQSTNKYPFSMKFHRSISMEEMSLWLKRYTRDEYIERFVERNVKEQKRIDEETNLLEKKKGDAVVSLMPDVVYEQAAMRDHEGKEITQCVLFNNKAYSFAEIAGSFRDFLDLSTSQRTLNDVFTQLSEKYNVPKDRLMNSFLPIIKMLLGQGFFTVG